ncbi:PTS system, sugar-specific IIA component [Enterococcus sp. AZ091]|uniref:PTS sugar transporter subunit IIA n=1 Tax=Enterococcus TaxID=1350 RepID=UPI002091659F|nr:PTS glucose transporter subunit IIA [Enterococcus gallinarum]MCO5475910.1 PTS glucose transporter subunit IIA [Enterococcus gallinarum]
MFGVLKKKKTDTEVLSPVNGEIIKIEEVEDPVFNQKMMGEGFAVKPFNGEISSPISGIVNSIFPTKHALTIEGANGLHVLIHVGLDTVALKGEGFNLLVTEGQKVNTGDMLLSVDLEVLKNNAKNNTVIVAFPEQVDLQLSVNEGVATNKTVAATVK